MIRKAEEKDLEQIADIWLDTNQKAHAFLPGSYWKEKLEPVKQMLPQAEIYLYAEEESGKILGFVGLDGNYIAGIFVTEEAQSQGIGRQLLNHAKACKGHLTLKVYEKNPRAVRFYQREGFVLQEEGWEEQTGEKEFLMIWNNPSRQL